MSNYTKSTNFATKDNLTPGDPLKVVRGTEIDTEFNNISTAIATKTDNSAAAITGGSITGITDLAIADGGTGASTATAALNNLLPSQTSAANKYLQSDGTNASWDAVTLSTADITGTLPVANGGTGVTSSTGTGSVVLSNSPTLVTPALGTPASGVATNLTGLPISTGVSGLGTGVATFLGTPSSANLASAVSDETGSGALVFANSPTLVTPALGTPSALVGTNITGTASGLTAGNVTTNANLTGAVTSVGNATSLGSFTSSQLAGALTDETGSGANVFATSPTLVTPVLGVATATSLQGIIGNVTPAAGAFTTVDASGAVTLSGGTANGVTYLNGSKVLTSGSALQFDGTGLGVGTSASAYPLTVQANANTQGFKLVGRASDNLANVSFTANNGSTEYAFINTGATYFSLGVGGSENFRATSTSLYTASGINVGIGTSSTTGAKLIVVGGALTVGDEGTYSARFGNNSLKGVVIGYDTTNNVGHIGSINPAVAWTDLVLNKNGGNLGLGVTPSAWLSTRKAFQIGATGSIASSSGNTLVGENFYTDSTPANLYLADGFATAYQQTSGEHRWLNAASGTAGGSVSFSQAMTLDASGNLGVGTTSIVDISGGSGKTLEIYGGSQGGFLHLTNSTTGQTVNDGFVIGASIGGSDALLIQRENASMIFRTNDTERVRIDSSGNLLVGTTSQYTQTGHIVTNTDTATYGISIKDTGVTTGLINFANSAGTQIGNILVTGGTAVSYNSISDYRLKTVVGSVAGQGARIDALKPVDYLWTDGGQQARGFLAHEFQTVYPNSVSGNKDATDADGNPVYQAMQASTSEVIADLVAEIQSLRQRVAQLETN